MQSRATLCDFARANFQTRQEKIKKSTWDESRSIQYVTTTRKVITKVEAFGVVMFREVGGGSYIGRVDCYAQRCGFRHPAKIQAERSRYLQIACGKTKTNNSYKAAENSQPAPYTICTTTGNRKPSTQNLKPQNP